ncbi:macro domain-containing protein [Acidovorax sp. 106]|uniref:macro domain-containing protein n=1 Tax=Acidovorax sp. 106 TaxID=2135637 RepID=UPI000F29E0E7|nr:macro domain-containing protein [Acidovorax sp. 106]RLJ37823.1 O-acetyl-ADP-ribose deacetylase (regulator of RNase III) [Acidovorax sp. 106]
MTYPPLQDAAPQVPVVRVVQGDLLSQDVDVIVNAWNRNIIPWWLLVPQGVSGAIKRRAGYQPFRELARHGPMPLGSAVLTAAGRLPYQGIIHVAGISMWWVASQQSIQKSVQSAMAVVHQHRIASVAFPVIGGGTGGAQADQALQWMQEVFNTTPTQAEVRVVRYSPQ